VLALKPKKRKRLYQREENREGWGKRVSESIQGRGGDNRSSGKSSIVAAHFLGDDAKRRSEKKNPAQVKTLLAGGGGWESETQAFSGGMPLHNGANKERSVLGGRGF